MRAHIVFSCALLLAATAEAAPATSTRHRAALERSCMAPKGLVARTAYHPGQGGSCAKLLSTDTILTPRAWNKT